MTDVDPTRIRFPDHHAAAPDELDTDLDPASRYDRVVLTTVGIDVGSTTSHLLFARLVLERARTALSSRFAVVERQVLHRSPISLTPYRADRLIDSDALGAFIDEQYRAAGLTPDTVDTGVVILTGTALERPNARAVAERLAAGGRFVCASAGHRLEALLAAHGSGAVARSRERGEVVLNVDVGGGTAKLALVAHGEVVATSAAAVGARLLTFAPDGSVARVEPAGEALAREVDVPLRAGVPLPPAARRQLAERMAAVVVAAAGGREPSARDRAHLLLPPLPLAPAPATLVFSGGVAELIYGRTGEDFGDLGHELAAALRRRAREFRAALVEDEAGIRATVIGAAQFSVQVSGNTIHLADPGALPLRNVPVVRARLASERPSADEVAAAIRAGLARLDLSSPSALAVALPWRGDPGYAELRALAEGISSACRGHRPLVVALEADVARTLGRILAEELGVGDGLVVIDGLELRELDYVDVGTIVRPANVVPVIIKSFVFAEPEHR